MDVRSRPIMAVDLMLHVPDYCFTIHNVCACVRALSRAVVTGAAGSIQLAITLVRLFSQPCLELVWRNVTALFSGCSPRLRLSNDWNNSFCCVVNVFITLSMETCL